MTPAPPDPRAAPRLPYMPGVDGLRALAVAAVVVYHLGAAWLPGGFLGVDVFLVISGYLITSLLLAEHRRSGRVDLRRFWLRRARRLLPAVVAMIVVTLAVMVVAHPDEVARLRGAVAASLGYVTNWYLIFADLSYFEQFGRPSLYQHLWSLAVEEQFYLLWPLAFAGGLALVGRRGLAVGVAVGGAASTALAWVLFRPDADPSRIYYGTDTRAVALLAGVGLAFAWPASRLAPVRGDRARAVLDAAGAAALAGVLALMATVGELDPALYRGGFLLIAVATAGLVAVAAHPSSRVGAAFAAPPLVWIGLRSYGIYLWHWPVIMLTRPGEDVPLDGPALVALRVALTLAAAEASYRLVEQPIRRGGLAAVRRALAPGAPTPRRRERLALSGACAAALVALGVAVASAPTQTSLPGLPVDAAGASVSEVSDPDPPRAPAGQEAPGRGREAGGRAHAGPVIAVGDSVMLGAAPALRAALGPRVRVDAAISRQFDEGADTIRARVRSADPAAVVVHLGNNGYVPFDGLEALMGDLRGVPRVVLVNTRVPLRWQDSVNDALAHAARRAPNAVLVDWHGLSLGSPELLIDGVHTSAEGSRVYAGAIAGAVGGPGSHERGARGRRAAPARRPPGVRPS